MVFKENDWVLLKFSKARLRHTTGKGTNGRPTGHQKYYAKLAKRYYGPFQILKPINEVDYKLKSPNTWLIRNAFHVSLLKPYKGEPPKEPIIEEPPKFDDQEEILHLERILCLRTRFQGVEKLSVNTLLSSSIILLKMQSCNACK